MAESCLPSRGMANLIEHLLLARHLFRIDTQVKRRKRTGTTLGAGCKVDERSPRPDFAKTAHLGKTVPCEAEKDPLSLPLHLRSCAVLRDARVAR